MMGWQWHQLEHMQIICTSLQTDNHTSTSPLFSQARCPSCRPTNSVKALKANTVGWLVGWLVDWLEFNVPFQHKYGYIRDERSGMESYPYPLKEG